ncbi:MAG TPA: exodeoxyribonuclease VII large subunit [Oculatellaceae cyanobacterium]|jgi:exodeoxyribonuclease VII large subunit
MSPRARKNPQEAVDAGQQRLDFSAVVATSSLAAEQPMSYTVSELTALLTETIELHPVLGRPVVVRGELSNVKRSSRGHVYFTLKDDEAAIGGILWASTANRLAFELKDGLEVFLTGRLEIYKPSGTYSIVASKMEPVGVGALQLAFLQIKAKLEAEGLFLPEYKKPIPEFPERIGIVTSATGAVIHDMLRVIRRKNPLVHVLLAPAKVQGEGAALEIAQAIRELNHPSYQLDVLIVARGGGSFEDLFCFSEEPAVRAVFESRVPIVTGIGHEPDFSLCDAAADYSASTPTAAADWAVPDIQLLREMQAERTKELLEHMMERLLECEQTLDMNATRLIELHAAQLEGFRQKLEQRQERMLSQFELWFQKKEQSLAQVAATLEAFSPLKTLARGYAIATGKGGHVVSRVAQVQTGDSLTIRVSDGVIETDVKQIARSVEHGA